MRPDLIKLGKLNKEYGIHTNHIFTTDTFHPDSVTYARHFGPVMGLWEDPATAMAAGGLGVYLIKYGMTSSRSMTMEQGNDPGSLAQLMVELDYKGERISEVRVGGLAATSIVKRVRIESGKAVVVDEALCPV
jgi:PhzF family phenazine biosynthesis protein